MRDDYSYTFDISFRINYSTMAILPSVNSKHITEECLGMKENKFS